MAKSVNLKNAKLTFFRKEFLQTKQAIQDRSNVLKVDAESRLQDSPIIFAGMDVPPNEGPDNFYDKPSLDEAARGDSYKLFGDEKRYKKGEPVVSSGIEFEAKSNNLFDIKTTLSEKGVNSILQDRLINFILQTRIAGQFELFKPVTTIASDYGNIMISPNTDKVTLKVTVKNKDQLELRIDMIMESPSMEAKMEVGKLSFKIKFTESIYLQEMSYAKIGKTKQAQTAFAAIATADYSWWSEVWSSAKQFFGFDKYDPDFELVPPAPTSSY